MPLYIYCTCSRLEKAAEAAILARQWSKAVQIVDMLTPEQAGSHYQLLATHFASSRDFPMAEKYFLKADMAQVCMHTHTQTHTDTHTHTHTQPTCIIILFTGSSGYVY